MATKLHYVNIMQAQTTVSGCDMELLKDNGFKQYSKGITTCSGKSLRDFFSPSLAQVIQLKGT